MMMVLRSHRVEEPMPQMQPAEALATCEQALRSLIATVLAKKLGKDWVSQVFPEKRVAKIREVREEEAGRRTRRGSLRYRPANWRTPSSSTSSPC
jgi:hypothetical protein